MLEDLLHNYIDSGELTDVAYIQLKRLAVSICQKNKVSKEYYENGIVDDMVSEAVVSLPEYYNKLKGTARGAVYIFMSQFLADRYKHLMAEKRGVLKTVYIEDTSTEHFASVLELELSSDFYKQELATNKTRILKLLKNNLSRKVGKHIINAILSPEKYEVVNNSFTTSIAQKSKVSQSKVYKVLTEINTLVGELCNEY